MVSREEPCLPSRALTTDPTTNFDPAHDGFGFPNPVGWAPNRSDGGALLGRLDALVYEKGLCFGMVVASLATFYAAGPRRPPLAELPLTANLLETLRECQLRQFQPRVVLTTVLDWLTSGGREAGAGFWEDSCCGREPGPACVVFRTGAQPEVRFVLCTGTRRCAVPGRGGEGIRLRPELSAGPGEVRRVLAGRRTIRLRRVSVSGGVGDCAS
jgi:hypothetical protein